MSTNSEVGAGLLRRARLGPTEGERGRKMAGDEYLDGGTAARVVMTRGISIRAAPERVWPWIAQLGRGAGWYSVDWLDNGRKTSARHIVSWIPEPRLGDATPIGYLRHLDPPWALAWWVDGVRFFGARAQLVSSFRVEQEGEGTRLVSRMSGSATGTMAHIALFVFRVMDSVMARRQLLGIRERVEYCEAAGASERDPETGKRDQYQLYEVVYADGESAGVKGNSDGATWRQAAIADGVLPDGES